MHLIDNYKKYEMQKPDSLIFDMDGTLWDAIDTYAAAWNESFKQLNIDRIINKEIFAGIMGWEKKKALEHMLPEYEETVRETIYENVVKTQDSLIPKIGGTLYEQVKEGIADLSTQYKIFIVSNCPKDTIKQFINWSGLAPFVTDEMAHGVNSKPKHHNIKLIIEKHNLQSTVYIGDTDSDRIQSELAGVPFAFVSYGFGKTDKYDIKFDSFHELTNYFMHLK